MPTVIDELVVRVGLDNKQYKKKSAETKADFKQTKREAQKAAFGISDALRVVGLVAGGKYLASFAAKTIESSAGLSRMATNLSTAATSLNDWGRAVGISGGDASGLQNTVKHLSQELTNLKITGQSSLIPFLRILRADIVDSTGKALPFERIIKNIGAGLRAIPDRADAFNIAQQMGLDEGTFNLLMKGDQAIDGLLAKMRQRAGLSEQDYQRAERLNTKWREFNDSLDQTSMKLVSDITPALERVMDEVIDINDAFEKSGGIVKTVADNWELYKQTKVGGVVDKAISFMFGSDTEASISKSGISDALLEAQIQVESGGNPKAINKGDIRVTGQPSLGLAQFQPATAKQYGIDPMDPADARRGQKMYMTDLFKQFGSVQKALAAYNWGPGNLKKTIDKHGDDWLNHIPKSTRDYVAKIEQKAPNMSIGAVNVYTQATDAKGVARDIRGELAQQADYGLR